MFDGLTTFWEHRSKPHSSRCLTMFRKDAVCFEQMFVTTFGPCCKVDRDSRTLSVVRVAVVVTCAGACATRTLDIYLKKTNRYTSCCSPSCTVRFCVPSSDRRPTKFNSTSSITVLPPAPASTHSMRGSSFSSSFPVEGLLTVVTNACFTLGGGYKSVSWIIAVAAEGGGRGGGNS